jgi:hypothetical protein
MIKMSEKSWNPAIPINFIAVGISTLKIMENNSFLPKEIWLLFLIGNVLCIGLFTRINK